MAVSSHAHVEERPVQRQSHSCEPRRSHQVVPASLMRFGSPTFPVIFSVCATDTRPRTARNRRRRRPDLLLNGLAQQVAASHDGAGREPRPEHGVYSPNQPVKPTHVARKMSL